jgi:Mg-chelatase subunit ChlD
MGGGVLQSVTSAFRRLSTSDSKSDQTAISDAEVATTSQPVASNSEGADAVRVFVTMENAEYPAAKSGTQLVMASLRAPSYAPDSTKRSKLRVVAVLDRSGSMSGAKLALVQQTIEFLASKVLQRDDELAIVAYDDRIETPLGLTKMDTKGSKQAVTAVRNIAARGCTNLSGGLFKGLELCQPATSSDVTAVLLFTDGLANAGVTAVDALASQTRSLAAACSQRPSIFTFGFGEDHDENMLRAIAETSNGTYYFVKGKDDIPQAFGDCFGGLVSVVAQNIKLRFESVSPHVSIKHIEGLKSEPAPNGGILVSIGDLYSEEERDVLCTVEVAPSEVAVDDASAVRCTAEYVFIPTASFSTIFASGTLRRPEVATSTPSVEVDQHRNRILVAQAIDEATMRADRGDRKAGQALLEEARQSVLASVSSQTELSRSLVADLTAVASSMAQAEEYQRYGSKMSKAKMMSHVQQRCNYSNYAGESSLSAAFDGATEQYSTAAKKSMKMKLGPLRI